jgi:hypothetical protein
MLSPFDIKNFAVAVMETNQNVSIILLHFADLIYYARLAVSGNDFLM